MGFSVKHATKIIAISNATRKDLIRIYNADPNKIEVIYHGFDKLKYHPVSSKDHIPEDIKKYGKYIFFIGRLEAKKNVVTLIRAYGELRKDSKIKHKLVLAGRPGYLYENIVGEIEKLDPGIKKDVIELGYVSEEKVPYLMRFSSIFAFPSRFEGFGMPLVEAMASGIPIVASNSSSIPEIVSDSALLYEPGDYIGFSEGIKKIISDLSLSEKLEKKGLLRSKEFDWNESGKKTLRVIDKASRGH
jgi:glycosyltransferase involved in cell wall biosynthesis